MIIYTADTDWADEYILDFFFNEVEKYNSPWIIFATNKYERFQNLKKKGYEIGIHPNFISCINRSEMIAEVERLKKIFPEATYSRSHSLLSGGPIWDALEQSGITHDFTLFNPYSESTRKRILWNGLIQVEFNWEDDFHFHIKDFNVDHSARIIKKKDLILNFHPIHFFLNTKSKNDYLEYLSVRDNRQKIGDLQKRNWESGFGCGNLLLELLQSKPSTPQSSLVDEIERLQYMDYLWT
jgi:hypothetical protein